MLETLTAAVGARLNTRGSYAPTHFLWSRGLALLCDHNGGFDYVRLQRGGGRPPLAYDAADFADVRDGDLVWVRAKSLPHFLEHVLPHMHARFALITGDEDWSIPADFVGARAILANDNVICWFAQNADTTKASDKLFPLPIGLDFHTIANRRKWKHWQATPQQQEAELERIRARMPANGDRLMRAHADFHLNKGVHPEFRNSVQSILRTNPNVDFQTRRVSRSALWRTKTRYAFVISPHGHGLDCHRTWESLALGNIPIVKRSPLDTLYDGLPVVIVNEWEEITAAALRAWHVEHRASFTRAEVQERLTNRYWIERVRRTLKERCEPSFPSTR
ncbi:MAG TPA: hypothetical protein VGO46_06105 [Gemmatimonadaceae bacterium]|nr:hypothetical protein [Gemmatimonadaceae bacterium]